MTEIRDYWNHNVHYQRHMDFGAALAQMARVSVV
jgi:hypothetical protein